MNRKPLVALLLSLLTTAAVAGDGKVGKLSEISLGGKLYDNHWLQAERLPPLPCGF